MSELISESIYDLAFKVSRLFAEQTARLYNVTVRFVRNNIHFIFKKEDNEYTFKINPESSIEKNNG